MNYREILQQLNELQKYYNSLMNYRVILQQLNELHGYSTTA